MKETSSITCDLCGLDAGTQPYQRNGRTFCCAGCMTVYGILREGKEDTVPPAEADVPAAYPLPAHTEEKLFHLTGLWCASCAWLIEHVLKRERGVASAEVMFFSDLLKVRYHPQYLPAGRIAERVRGLGYGIEEYTGDHDSGGQPRDLLLRLGVAAFLWLNVMFLNLGVYVGAFQTLPEAVHRVMPLVAMAATLPVILYSAAPILRSAALGARSGVLRMESLLSLGILAAFGYSAVEGMRGGTHIYFDIVCAITTLVLLGKWIEQNAKLRASRTISGLHRMLPQKARVWIDGRERFVAIDSLHPGDLFVVKAGERIPADGLVEEGESEADESLLTGESRPVWKKPGSVVVAGSMNLAGFVKARAAAVGAESTIARIVSAVEKALNSRSAIERKVDLVSRVFIPAVLVFAALTYLQTLRGAATNDALMRAITVLVIACPCALGIATPLALHAAVTRASKLGLLVRDSLALETVQSIDTIVLDKTGTVTEPDFSLLEVNADHLEKLASLEACSEHPLGRALVECARHLEIAPRRVTGVQVLKGLGIRGSLEGEEILIGSARLFPDLSESLRAEAAQWERSGDTVTFYSFGGVTSGLLAFGNRVRPETAVLIGELKRRGIRVLLVSGDSRATTQAVAEAIGADNYLAGTLPEEKAAIIRELQQNGHKVAMVGDGINDAPALAQADLGIALSSGTDLAMRSAAMVLMGGRLDRVVEAVDLSRRTLRVVRQNLFWAFAYNALGIGFAAAGLLNPIVAAAAMVVSSLTVVANSHRLAR
ncbi:MAG: cation-translocating P-type ATPase [Bryobacteraceae bacterium]|nr:cation-translocating P-type ATPase [Bryobacteraceae bacterium]